MVIPGEHQLDLSKDFPVASDDNRKPEFFRRSQDVDQAAVIQERLGELGLETNKGRLLYLSLARRLSSPAFQDQRRKRK